MEELEGGWLPSINGFSSSIRSMMKDFGVKIFVASSVHGNGTYGFAIGIVVDVADIVDGESCHGMATIVFNSSCEYGGGLGTIGFHGGRAGWNSEMLSIGHELFLIRVFYWT